VPSVTVGGRLEVPGVVWQDSAQNVVLFLHTTCRFCEASASYYKDLSTMIRGRSGARLIVLSPEPAAIVEAWLGPRGVRADQVVQVRNPASNGLSQTPTLLFVSDGGVVTDVLVGKLQRDAQEAVSARISGEGGAVPLNNVSEPKVLDRHALDKLAADVSVTVVDVRDREEFRAQPRPGARNIPLDELSVRAPAEFSKGLPTVVDCSIEKATRCRGAADVLRKAGFSNVMVFVP